MSIVSTLQFKPFKQDRKLTDVLAEQKFTLSAEVIPPRNGSEQGKVLQQIDGLITAGAQFLAVTKGAGGSLRGGSLPIVQVIKENFGVPCIAHFTCRDLNPPDVENQLMDHHYFGIRNILALRGDPPDGQPNWVAREGGYSYAYQLIEQIRKLNEGVYLHRSGGPAAAETLKTDFCIGAAAYPDHPDEKERIDFFKLKAEAGAEYGITNLLFDPDSYGRFLDLCHKHQVRIPILPGTRFLKTRSQAARMVTKFGVKVPLSTMDALPEVDGPDSTKRGLEIFMKLTEKLKALGAPGIHIYVIADAIGSTLVLRQLASEQKQGKE
jgi:methylenetetrahydrofolate reductase (NADPH)